MPNYKMNPGSKQRNTPGNFSKSDSQRIEKFRKRDTGAGKRVVQAKDRGKPGIGSQYANPTSVSLETPLEGPNKKGYNL